LSSSARKLVVGSQVFYPAHGVASVRAIEERVFGPSPESFYVLVLARGDRLLLPVGNVAKAGVRKLISAAKARKLLKTATTAPASDTTTSWKARAATYLEGLRSGCPDRYTEILRYLLFRARTAKLSTSDRDALRVARGYFVGEVTAVLDQPAHEIDEILDGDVSSPAAKSGPRAKRNAAG
jgi:CarD family transcriptional regulator